MKPRVLILCTGNSARSQMAEGLLRHLADDTLEVHSAGTNPIGVSPLAVEAMREIGIDISQHRSKSVSEFDGQRFDTVITVCDSAAEHCPVFPGTHPLEHLRPRRGHRLTPRKTHRLPSRPRRSRVAPPRLLFIPPAPQARQTLAQRALFNVTQPLSFHALTKCPSRNPFVLTFMQNDGGV